MTCGSRRAWIGAVACGVALWASAVGGAEYYFSAAGNDATGDGTLAKPWQSVGRFNSLNLNPGDQVYFRAGDTFVGRLVVDEQDSGVDGVGALVAPVTIGSYGSTGAAPRAIIHSPLNGEALYAYNAGGLEVRDLEFASGGWTGSMRKSGVLFYTDKAAAGALRYLNHVRLTNVSAHGFSSSGVDVYAAGGVGFADVEIRDGDFYANAFGGVNVGAARWQELIHANVRIDSVQAHGNPGFAGCEPHCGHGAVVAQVDGAVIQNSVAYDNGVSFGKGNVGLWAWQSNEVIIQGNLAYGNRSPAGGDGGAFDLDGGVTNSIVQYNRSYNNDGAGLLLAQFGFAEPMSQNVFRYNLSVNDGRDGYGGITIWGNSGADVAASAVFHNNTVVVDETINPNARGAVWFLGGNHDELALVNNAIVALDGAALVAGDTSVDRAALVGNSYWTDGGPVILENASWASVEAWAQATGQEQAAGAFAGVTSDPHFVDETSYRPQAFSPLVDAALTPGIAPWPGWINDLGPRDFVGAAIYQVAGPDIGAWEVVVADFDGNGVVDADDLDVWAAEYGSTDARRADLDGDGAASGLEFLEWQRRHGGPSGVASVVVSAPEPGASLLCASAAAMAVFSGRNTRFGRGRPMGKRKGQAY